MSTPTPERLREIADRMDDTDLEVYQDHIDDLRAWARELEGSTQPPLPTREELADAMLAGMQEFWATPPSKRPPQSQRNELLAAAGALIAHGWVRVSGETP